MLYLEGPTTAKVTLALNATFPNSISSVGSPASSATFTINDAGALNWNGGAASMSATTANGGSGNMFDAYAWVGIPTGQSTGTSVGWSDGYDVIFPASTGTVTIDNGLTGNAGKYNYTANSFTFNTDYTLENGSPSAAASDTLTGPLTINGILTLNPNATFGGKTFLDGDINGTGSINIVGATAGGSVLNEMDLYSASTLSINVPISITGTTSVTPAYAGVIGRALTYSINNGITNNSPFSTLLWAGTGGGVLNVNSLPITGSADLYLGASVAGSGNGTVHLNVTNTNTGSTFLNASNTTGIVICGATNDLGTGGNNDLVWAVNGEGGEVDMAGFNQTIGSLSAISGSGGPNGTLLNSANSLATLTIQQHTNTNYFFGITKGAGGSSDIAVVVNGTSAGNLNFRGSVSSFTGGLTVEGGSTVTLNSSTVTTNVLNAGNLLTLGGTGTSGTLALGVNQICSNLYSVKCSGKFADYP